MKRLIFLLFAFSAVGLYAQNPDDLDRDRSKYATYSFSNFVSLHFTLYPLHCKTQCHSPAPNSLINFV